MKFYKSEETLNKILEIISNNKRGGYFRFGDGDINLAIGLNDMLQNANSEISMEMKESISIIDENVLKTLPLYCVKYDGIEPGMFPGNHETTNDWADDIVRKAIPIWGSELIDVYSHAALHYLATYKEEIAIDFLKKIKDKVKIFIGNENIPIEILKLITSDDCYFIKTPPRNSYSKINEIEKEFDMISSKINLDYYVTITSMGCSGRIMQKRIYNKNINTFLFDFGSLLDAMCGWNTRAWIELTKFDSNNFNKKLKLI